MYSCSFLLLPLPTVELFCGVVSAYILNFFSSLEVGVGSRFVNIPDKKRTWILSITELAFITLPDRDRRTAWSW